MMNFRLLGVVCLYFVLGNQFSLAKPVLNLEQVAQGIYVHVGPVAMPSPQNHGEIANIGFIEGQDCIAVIDSGGSPQQGQELKAAIQKISSKPICYVINTHVHPDHVYGNKAFQDGRAKFVGHHKLARAMAARSSFYTARSKEQLGFELTAADLIPPDIEVKDSLTLSLGGRDLLLKAHASAHTDNDLSVYDPTTQTMWLSDLLFVTHLPVIDGSVLGWLKEMEQLAKQSYRTVIPGHGQIVRDWSQGLNKQREYLQNLVSEIKKLQQQGKYLEDALKILGDKLPAEWSLASDFHKKNISSAFAELEWEHSD